MCFGNVLILFDIGKFDIFVIDDEEVVFVDFMIVIMLGFFVKYYRFLMLECFFSVIVVNFILSMYLYVIRFD